MNPTLEKDYPWFDPGALCRMDDRLLVRLASPGEQDKFIRFACLAITVCTALYGFAFGVWRSPEQALYSSLKLPVLFFSTLLFSAMICTMLAQVMGSGLTFKTVCMTVLLGMAVTSMVMASLVPAIIFIVMQLPSASDAWAETSMRSYRVILVLNTVVIGFCGCVGNGRLYRLLKSLTGSSRLALGLNLIWILIMGLTGCELSWIISPFLARPDIDVPFFNPNAFTNNFFEYLWNAISELR